MESISSRQLRRSRPVEQLRALMRRSAVTQGGEVACCTACGVQLLLGAARSALASISADCLDLPQAHDDECTPATKCAAQAEDAFSHLDHRTMSQARHGPFGPVRVRLATSSAVRMPSSSLGPAAARRLAPASQRRAGAGCPPAGIRSSGMPSRALRRLASPQPASHGRSPGRTVRREMQHTMRSANA